MQDTSIIEKKSNYYSVFKYLIMKSVQGTEQAEQKASTKEMIICFPVCKHQIRPGYRNFPCQIISQFGQLNSGSS